MNYPLFRSLTEVYLEHLTNIYNRDFCENIQQFLAGNYLSKKALSKMSDGFWNTVMINIKDEKC